MTMMKKLVFLWDNFGPLHVDRCEAVAVKFEGVYLVVGIELAGQSKVYDWVPARGAHFSKITVTVDRSIEEVKFYERFYKTLRVCLSMGSDAQYFLCHYQDPAIFFVSAILRVLGRRVFTIGCSKFDDYERNLRREVLKSIYYWPYNGAIASGTRSRDYVRFLGLPVSRIESSYNTVSLQRIRDLAGAPPAPDGISFGQRHFTIVARLVPKKNLSIALKAMAHYVTQTAAPRPLHIFGTGPLEPELREQARLDGISHLVHFEGFVQTAGISEAYGRTLALLLPSKEEQFGNVVPEAMAMGLPIVLSENCGARDQLVRSGLNGFVVEPDNPIGLAYFMQLLSEDEALWRRMCKSSQEFAKRADSERFAESVERLILAVGG